MTGIEIALIVGAVISASAAVYQGVEQMTDDSPERAAKLQQERLLIEKQRRAAEMAHQKAELRRERRARQSSIINTGAAEGVIKTTSVQNAYGAVGQSASREGTFLDQTFALADAADNITSQQIKMDASTAMSNNFNEGIGSIAKGVGYAAKGYGDWKKLP
jgi:hypothetical protein